MKTFLDHDPPPTLVELSNLDNDYSVSTREEYISELVRRADVFRSSVEYEATCVMQQLAKLRCDQEALKKYTGILDVDFADITNRIFNE